MARHGRRLHAASAATASCCPAKRATTATTYRATAALRLQPSKRDSCARSRRSATASSCRRLSRLQLPHAHRLRAGRDRQSIATTGLCVGTMLNATGKPPLVGRQSGPHHQRGDVRAVVHGRRRRQPHHAPDDDALPEQRQDRVYVNRWGPNGEQWPITKMRVLLRQRRPTKSSTPWGTRSRARQFGTTELDGLSDAGSGRTDADLVHHERRELGRPSTRPAPSTGRRRSSRSTRHSCPQLETKARHHRRRPTIRTGLPGDAGEAAQLQLHQRDPLLVPVSTPARPTRWTSSATTTSGCS